MKIKRKLAKEFDSVLVWCGSVTIEDIFIGRVAIPDYCWKVLYIKKLNKVVSYSFRNDSPRLEDLHSYEVSLDSIQHLSKLHFFKDENTHLAHLPFIYKSVYLYRKVYKQIGTSTRLPKDRYGYLSCAR